MHNKSSKLNKWSCCNYIYIQGFNAQLWKHAAHFTLKTPAGSRTVYPGSLHTGPSPVVSTEASPASPPSSFYPLCIFYPSVHFFRLSPSPAPRSLGRAHDAFFLSFPTRFFPTEQKALRGAASCRISRGEKNIHPRRQGGGRVRIQQRPFWHLTITTAPAETLLLLLFIFLVSFSMSASLNISQGFSSLVACTLAPPFFPSPPPL